MIREEVQKVYLVNTRHDHTTSQAVYDGVLVTFQLRMCDRLLQTRTPSLLSTGQQHQINHVWNASDNPPSLYIGK